MLPFEQQDIPVASGESITARFFPPVGAVRGMVLVVPGIAIPQTYYAAFAGWLARQGFLVATFDYRGIGLSLRGDLRQVDTDLLGWAAVDCAAMVSALDERAPELPLLWIGHSLGGQILPMVPNHARVDKMLTIATGSGYWRENSPALKRIVWWMWYVAVPLSVPLFGYFPGKLLRMVGDLPRGVIRQWRQWCLNRDYLLGVEGQPVRERYLAMTLPIVSLSFTDDEFMSARNTESIHGFFANAPRTMRRIAPADMGVKRIGHFGFFKAGSEQTLWQPLLLPELSL
ncbi:alpha/beta fold hydrolase [Oxalobacteraceae bacterium]|nr:alpha/beta fold hydrolase [Oxalobacteraceae bacterium]